MPLLLPEIRTPVSLRRLFPLSSFVGCADIVVSDATEHSSQCGPDSLFAALPGTRTEGANFVSEAIGRGATSLLVQRPIASVNVPQCVVPCASRAFSVLCECLAGNPSDHLHVAGVTGTNGKTTTTWLIRSILQTAGRRTGLLGTIEYSDGLDASPSSLTTPDSRTSSNWLRDMLDRGTTYAAIELSSHALAQDRAAGVRLEAAVVTNITQDHFDYHSTAESYRASKERIFERCHAGAIMAINADDPGCRSLKMDIAKPGQLVTYGLDTPADITAEIVEDTCSGSRFVIHIDSERVEVTTSLVGRHNVSNCLAAAVVARHFGVSSSDIARGIEALPSVPGRLESIELGQPFNVYVDYAHTDDALRHCIHSLRQVTPGRTICVFGAGGDRDRSKRPLLAAAAAEADLAVVTSDNPRTEDPERIIEDILAGFPVTADKPYVETDRRSALRWALQEAEPGDCVLVAGKGHETEQIIGTNHLAFDDRTEVRHLLAEQMHSYERGPLKMPA